MIKTHYVFALRVISSWKSLNFYMVNERQIMCCFFNALNELFDNLCQVKMEI